MQFVGPQYYAGFHEVCIINALYPHISPLKLLKEFSTAVCAQASENCLILTIICTV